MPHTRINRQYNTKYLSNKDTHRLQFSNHFLCTTVPFASNNAINTKVDPSTHNNIFLFFLLLFTFFNYF